jgi:hypothetical protein
VYEVLKDTKVICQEAYTQRVTLGKGIKKSSTLLAWFNILKLYMLLNLREALHG